MKAVIKGCKANFDIITTVPGDKSISHRSLIIGTIPKGVYTIENYAMSEDCKTTIEVLKSLGVSIVSHENKLLVNSPGVYEFHKDVEILDCKNSGTTARLISGLICGANIKTKLIGDESLSKRPMGRVIDPLEVMGGNIYDFKGTLPIRFEKNRGLTSIEYELPVPSAQVKSAVLIAGFLSNGVTKVIEPIPTRDHTENLFKFLGARVEKCGDKISIENSPIICKDIIVPADPSSASFLICAALLGHNIKLTVQNVLLNESRKTYIDILKAMGASIEIVGKGIVNNEPVGDLVVYSSELKGVKIEHHIIPSIIDEIPVLSVVAAFAAGETVFQGVEELKVKESDRVEGIVKNLRKANLKATYSNNNLIIQGFHVEGETSTERSVSIETNNDHRIAMAFAILAMKLKATIIIDNWDCTEISFPDSKTYFSKFMNFMK